MRWEGILSYLTGAEVPNNNSDICEIEEGSHQFASRAKLAGGEVVHTADGDGWIRTVYIIGLDISQRGINKGVNQRVNWFFNQGKYASSDSTIHMVLWKSR